MKTTASFENYPSSSANCNTLTFDAPIRWLLKGWHDFRGAPLHSITYGLIFATIGWLLVYIGQVNESYLMPSLFFVMLFIGPALAFGLYDISQQLERNHKPSFSHERKKAFSEMGHELMLSLMMTLVLMIIFIAASIAVNISAMPWQTGVTAPLAMSDTHVLAVTGIFAALLFCVNLFALPMILDQDVNAGTATTTSLNAVWKNKTVLAAWALIVLALTAVGIATALIGFVLIVPVLGYASWHAYRETINIKK